MKQKLSTSKKFRVMFLKSEKARQWKAGVWKYTYTNSYPSVKELHCLSGDYIYIIKLSGVPEIVSWKSVPKGYRNCLDKSKFIYKNRARLVKIVSRNLRKKVKPE